ncbi:MAG: copper transporter [Bacillota bacterium]
MIIDIRYHIITLVAVFLMLGLGILIGTTMIGSEAIERKQEQLADRLEKQLQGLRLENQRAQERYERVEAENRTLQLFAREVVPFAIANRLKGFTVAVVEVSGAASQELLSDLQTAGAVVESVTTVPDDFADAVMVEKLQVDLGWNEESGGEVQARLGRELGTAIATGENSALVDYLVREGLVEVSGGYNMAVQGVVIVGAAGEGDASGPSPVELGLIDGLLAQGAKVVVVRESTGTSGNIKEYQQRKISIIDNIDMPWGRVALILALSGQAGNYRSDPEGKRLLPPYPVGGAE